MAETCQKPNWHDQCCCNCRFHIQDFHHCVTAPELRDASDDKCVCSVPKGWICLAPEMEGRAYSGWAEHGMCEMWTPKRKPIAADRCMKCGLPVNSGDPYNMHTCQPLPQNPPHD